MTTNSPNHDKLAVWVQRFMPQSTLLYSWELPGGVSTGMTAFALMRPDGQVKKMIARRPDSAVLARNPQAAADEFRLLQILQAANVAAPTPYYLDQSGDIFPAPLLIIEFITGETQATPSDVDDFVHQQAAHLARIHQIHGKRWDLSFLPQQETIYMQRLEDRPTAVNDALLGGRARDVLEAVWPLPSANEPGLLHGDFWWGNLLWREGRLTAVIDWENAAVGDPLADLAICRLEMLWMFDAAAMQHFTAYYQAMTQIDFSNLPYWELCTVLRPAFQISAWTDGVATARAFKAKQVLFLQQALARLGL